MLIKYRNLLFAIAIISLSACSTKYGLIKSNREDYSINSKIEADSSIIKTYLPYKIKLDAEMNKIIGYSEVVLTKQSAIPESVLGNFFADAVFNQAKKIESNIDFTVPTTKGGLRNDVAKGAITVANIFELMPFENELVLFTLKGEDALNFINFVAKTNGQPAAGLKMNINNGKPENIIINGKAFDVKQNYQVLTSDYIASGGDDAVGFSNPIAKRNLNLKIRDALLKEVTQLQTEGKTINAKLDGRITKN
jgi:2',3'-cyclic-nucleotide 2'-phosphodiesterase (5'-nucleotidase family)